MLKFLFKYFAKFKLTLDEYLIFIKFENNFWHYKFAYFYVSLLGSILFFSPMLDFAYKIKPIPEMWTFKIIGGTCCIILLFLSVARVRLIGKINNNQNLLDNVLICLWYLCLMLMIPCYSFIFVCTSNFYHYAITQLIVSLIIFACFFQFVFYLGLIAISYFISYLYISYETNSFYILGLKENLDSLINIHLIFMLCGIGIAYLREVIVKSLMFQTTEMAAINANLEDLIHQRTLEIEDNLKLKNDFINNASHEIRIPLQGILSITQILFNDWTKLNEDKRYNYINLINHSCNRLMIFASNLLDFAKFHSGKSFLKCEHNNLASLIDEVIEDFSPFIISKGIKCKFTKHNEEIAFFFDKVKIQQVLRNLLSNALKYSNIGANIIIECNILANYNNKPDSVVELKFIDDGIGVPESEREKIFEIFTQSSNSFNSLNSSGLGLALVSEYIKMHKGKIWVESNEPKGSIFVIILPYLQKIKSFAKSSEDDKENFIKKEDSFSSMVYINEDKLGTFKRNVFTNFSELKGLIIDDELICLTSVSLMLESLGVEMHTEQDGNKAVETIVAVQPDFILLDIMLNGITAIEILEELSRLGVYKNIPIILQSGVVDANILKQSKDLGAWANIIKPYGKEQITYLLQKIFL